MLATARITFQRAKILSSYGLPTVDKVIAHTNMYWTWQTGPGRTAQVVDATDVRFDTVGATTGRPGS